MAIPYYSESRDGKNGHSDQRRRQPQARFSEVLEEETKSKDANDNSIDIQMRGYTRTGAPQMLSMHMHDYTNQTKHA